MKLFGFRIIREDEYQRLDHSDRVVFRVHQCQRWFSGWKDLEIIWDYLLGDSVYVRDVRPKYAEARGTDEYGHPRIDPS